MPPQLGMDRCGATLEESGVPVDKGCGWEEIMIACQAFKWHSSLFPGKVLSNLKSVTYSMAAINYLKPTATLMRRESFRLPGRNVQR